MKSEQKEMETKNAQQRPIILSLFPWEEARQQRRGHDGRLRTATMPMVSFRSGTSLQWAPPWPARRNRKESRSNFHTPCLFSGRYVLVVAVLMILTAACRKEEHRNSSLENNLAKIETNALSELRTKAESGDVIAQHDLGDKLAIGKEVPADYPAAAKWFRKAAEKGNASAQYKLGMLIINGHIAPIDKSEPSIWIIKAAEQQHPDAEFVLALLYDQGRFLAKNENQAGKWILTAAEHGQLDAQHAAGCIFAQGLDGVTNDHAQAAQWFRKAAEKGKPKSQFELAVLYLLGRGVEKNPKEAAKWLEKSAEQGYPTAQFILGGMYLRGDGVRMDLRKGAEWIRKAANQGYALAQLSLGALLAMGQGLEQNETEATDWFRKAAAQGNAKAQIHLGFRYIDGIGISKDVVEGYSWLSLGAQNITSDNAKREQSKVASELLTMQQETQILVGNQSLEESAAKILDYFSTQLTPAQISAAQQRILTLKQQAISRRPLISTNSLPSTMIR